MIEQLESNYDCANASEDLPKLMKELEDLRAQCGDDPSDEMQQTLNRLDNQIHFIRNKCRIH